MERETGLEPATPSLEGSCSSHLSYSRMIFLSRPFNGRSLIALYELLLFVMSDLGPPVISASLLFKTHTTRD